MKTAFQLARTAFAILAVTLSLSGCIINLSGLDNIVGNGVSKTEQRTITAVSGVVNQTSAEVEITCKQSPSLEITTDENLLQYIKTEVIGGVLTISTDRASISTRRLSIKIGTDMLTRATITGSGNMTVNALETSAFTGRIDGSGNVIVNGQSQSATYTVSGSGDINARNCASQSVVASISGSGNITTQVSQTLDGTISGSGSIIYFGNPGTVRRNITGSGSIVAGR